MNAVRPQPRRALKIFANFDCQTPYHKEKGCDHVRKRLFTNQSKIDRQHRCDHSLTPREREVLDWLARGKSNAQIAEILEISSATVSKHLEHIYPKLGVENRTAAASFATGSHLNI